VSLPVNQLLAYRFEPGSAFEGQLVGALERIESGGAMRVLDALFVAREPDSGEVVAVSLTGSGSAGIIGKLLDFRLGGTSRATATQRALDGPAGDTVRAIAELLEPGSAVAAVLVEHAWARTLGDAVARIGGSEAANELIEASRIGDALPRLRSAAGRDG
jgi:hypothetical protein